MRVCFRNIVALAMILISAVSSEYGMTTRLIENVDLKPTISGNFCQDNSGYMWFPTNYGLVRYDGRSFDTYLHNEKDALSISDNRILKLAKDEDGNLWIATPNGVNLYDRQADGFLHVQPGELGFRGYIIDCVPGTGSSLDFIIAGVGAYSVNAKDKNLIATPVSSGKEYERHRSHLTSIANISPGVPAFDNCHSRFPILATSRFSESQRQEGEVFHEYLP